MKDKTRVDEIDEFLRNGGSVEELMIEPEPSNYSREFSKVGLIVDKQKEKIYEYNRAE